MLKRVLFSILGALVALSIGAAGAYFTAQVTVSDSMIKGGSVAISTVPTTAPLSIDALAPGQSQMRPLQVVNSGSLPANVTLSAKKASGITDFYNALGVRVSCGDAELYNGPLSDMSSTPIELAPGARGDLEFEVSLPATATNSLANGYSKVSVVVDAEQVH